MAKAAPQYDDEIDLIELIQVFWAHRLKYIILGVMGLVLGLVYTHQHTPVYSIKLKAHVGHPFFTTDTLINSSSFQTMFNACEVSGQMPCYQFNKKTEVISVTHLQSKELMDLVSSELSAALLKEADMIIQTAQQFKGPSQSVTIINNSNSNSDSNSNSNISWTNQDLAQLNPGDVVKTLSLSFGDIKTMYPNPIQHGMVGLFIGLLMAFLWMFFILKKQFRIKGSLS
jgi:hypothetical protein